MIVVPAKKEPEELPRLWSIEFGQAFRANGSTELLIRLDPDYDDTKATVMNPVNGWCGHHNKNLLVIPARVLIAEKGADISEVQKQLEAL